ncbi:MAG: hypothetical protein Q8R72_05755 [Hylemonella sp.]|nr:hypothetical protein [Hylemonella sp.]
MAKTADQRLREAELLRLLQSLEETRDLLLNVALELEDLHFDQVAQCQVSPPIELKQLLENMTRRRGAP